MGFLDKMKSAGQAMVGGGAKVSIEYPHNPVRSGDSIQVKLTVMSTGKEFKSGGVYVDIHAHESGQVKCKNCQQMYNIYFSAPKKGDTCDKCGGSLFQRDDDKEETIKKRLDVYDTQTAPLFDYYGKKGILKSVKGTGSIDDIFNEVCKILGS